MLTIGCCLLLISVRHCFNALCVQCFMCTMLYVYNALCVRSSATCMLPEPFDFDLLSLQFSEIFRPGSSSPTFVSAANYLAGNWWHSTTVALRSHLREG
ncbi:hypothetical protein HDV62DRAFT_371994 [Trichoderma sp. SZMC 28011]